MAHEEAEIVRWHCCPSKGETTYILMAHEEAEIVKWPLSFKERDHVHTDSTRRGQNREVALVLQSKTTYFLI